MYVVQQVFSILPQKTAAAPKELEVEVVKQLLLQKSRARREQSISDRVKQSEVAEITDTSPRGQEQVPGTLRCSEVEVTDAPAGSLKQVTLDPRRMLDKVAQSEVEVTNGSSEGSTECLDSRPAQEIKVGVAPPKSALKVRQSRVEESPSEAILTVEKLPGLDIASTTVNQSRDGLSDGTVQHS